MLRLLQYLLFLFRFWVVENGVRGESCAESGHPTELWCPVVFQPMCVDRTIRCSAPPNPAGANIDVLHTYIDDLAEVNTTIHYTCPGRKHFFDYPVSEDFVSYYYETNINDTTIACNNDG